MSSKTKSSSTSYIKMATAKEERNLTMTIMHALEDGRKIDNELFSRENSGCPPSISLPNGEMFHGTKSDLLPCLLQLVDTQRIAPQEPKALVIDASFLVQSLKPKVPCMTVEEYVNETIVPYVKNQLPAYERVDLVFDVYLDKSLKAMLRKTRGDGERKKVRLTTKLPRDFRAFLRVDENKSELNEIIAIEVSKIDYEDGTW